MVTPGWAAMKAASILSNAPLRDWAAKTLAEPDSRAAEVEANAVADDDERLVVVVLFVQAASRATQAVAISAARGPRSFCMDRIVDHPTSSCRPLGKRIGAAASRRRASDATEQPPGAGRCV